MTTDLIRSLTGTAQQPHLTFRRLFRRATVADVRAACTDPARLARWFGVVEGEPARVGDTYVAHLGDGPDDRATGRVEACRPDGFDVSWAWQDEAPSTVSVRFGTAADGAVLVVQHLLGEPDHAVSYGGGWEQLLGALARDLGSGADAGDAGAEANAADAWRTMSRHPLEVVREVPAPLQDVWRAFTTADGLGRWWWRHWADTTVEVDARPGGAYRITAPAAGITLSGTYLAVDEPRHLALTWVWADADGTSRDEAVDVRFEPAGEGALVRVRHTGPWADDAPVDNYRQGWEYTLGQLVDARGPTS